MIPIKLKIKGIYSYQEEQTIDFTQLTSANLFGIFGPVGSGKSTILEAITFAIYGRTDRLNRSGDNRYYNMMNLKSDEMIIDFIFECGEEQSLYRASVNSRRNSKNFDDVKTPEHKVYRKEHGVWTPITQEDLEEAVGLNYNNFKRTIIIPQGQFQEFLQLGASERTKMMKELFDLGKYEFYYQVTSLEKKNDTSINTIQGQLLTLGDINDEQLKIHEERLAFLTKDNIKLSNGLSENQKKEEKIRMLQTLIIQKQEAEIEQQSLYLSKPKFNELEKKITQYEISINQFKYLLDTHKQNIQKMKQRKDDIASYEKKHKEEQKEISDLMKRLTDIKPDYDNREILKNRHEELLHLKESKTLISNMYAENKRLIKGNDVWKKTNNQSELLKEEKTKHDVALKQMRKAIPDLNLLSSIQQWHTKKQNLVQNIADTNKEIEKLSKLQQDIQTEINKLFSYPLISKAEEINSTEQLSQLIIETGNDIKQKQQSLSKKEHHLLVREQLKTYSETLENGSPCPVCGSLHHPDRYKSEDIGGELNKIQQNKEALELQAAQLLEIEKQLHLFENRHCETLERLKEWQDALIQKQQQHADHLQQFVWQEYEDEKSLNEAFIKAKQLQKDIQKKEDELANSNTQWENKEKDKERFREELNKIQRSIASLQAKIDTHLGQLRLIKTEDYTDKSIDEIEEERKRLLSDHQKLEEAYTNITTSLQNKREQSERLYSLLEVNKRELIQEENTHRELELQINQRLLSSPFNTLDEVVQIISSPFQVEEEKARLQQFNDRLLSNQTTLERINKEIGDNKYDPEEHQQLLTNISDISQQITKNNMEQGNLKGVIKKLADDLEIQSRLHKEAEKLTQRADNLRTMKSLFKASGFVEYISSVYLQNLCNAANDRFYRLTRQQLSLELSDDNSFQVRDFMNGGKVRNVKTLSGGQTFQASLSLALALADNIQKITRSHQNFFFLDEGFGSLDKDSLDIVFDTLKSLRSENRVVGVISHVEEMQQEIDTHLRIENHPERGSLIYRSWEE